MRVIRPTDEISESYYTVIYFQDGYVSAEDVDKVLPYGLGPRYAFIGPLKVCHLNAEGGYKTT